MRTGPRKTGSELSLNVRSGSYRNTRIRNSDFYNPREAIWYKKKGWQSDAMKRITSYYRKKVNVKKVHLDYCNDIISNKEPHVFFL